MRRQSLSGWLVGLAVAAVSASVLSSCSGHGNIRSSDPMMAAAGSLPSTAALVDGSAISTSDVVAQAFQDDGSAALGVLIDYKLLDQAAVRHHIVVTSSEVAAKRAELIRQVGAVAFDRQVASHRVTIAAIDQKIRHEMILEQLSSAALPAPEIMLHARQILIATRPTDRGVDLHKPHSPKQALAIVHQIQARLAAGQSFTALAKQYSEDPYTRASGGDIGIIDQHSDPFGGAIWRAAQGLHPGQISGPVRSDLGYQLVQVISWSNAPLPSDAAAYAAVVRNVRQFAMQRLMQATMARLRSNAKIDETLFE